MKSLNINEKGFSLIEVVVALFILSISVITIYNLIISTSVSTFQLEQKYLAKEVASNRIALIHTIEKPLKPINRNGEMIMGGQKWLWEEEINKNMSNLKVDSIKGHDPTYTIDMDSTANLNVNGTMSVSGFDSQLAIPKGTTDQRPSSPSAGMIRFNTTINGFELYNGTIWSEFGIGTGLEEGDNSIDFDLYENSPFGSFISYMSSQKTTWASSGTNFQYATDASDTYISDAQSDMYDGGNFTQIRNNGSQSGNIGYNSSYGTYSSLKHGQLGYSWPLVSICVAPVDDTARTYGYSRSGNLGADGGGGTVGSVTVYSNATVQGFTPVNAWLVNKAWNQSSDPGVMHLYCTVGHPQWNSSTSNGFTTTDFSTSSNSDFSYYQSTSTNCFVWTALVSNGQTVGAMTQGQAQTFVNNFLASAKTHFGY